MYQKRRQQIRISYILITTTPGCLHRRLSPNKSAQPPINPPSYYCMDNSSSPVQDPAPEVSPLVTGVSSQTLTFASLSFAVLCLAGSRRPFTNCCGVWFLSAFVIFSRRKSGFRGNALLLVGAPDAGKTAILSTVSFWICHLTNQISTHIVAGVQADDANTHIFTDKFIHYLCTIVN
jgi:hypothetical protein